MNNIRKFLYYIHKTIQIIMKLNNKVENFYNKYRSNIILSSHNQISLESLLRDLFQSMYELGHADGFSDAVVKFNRLEEENGNL